MTWLESAERCGPGQEDPLFDWIAHYSSREQLAWFVAQETQREASFDEDLALTEVGARTDRHLRDFLAELRSHGQALGYGACLSEVRAALPNRSGIQEIANVLESRETLRALAASPAHLFHSAGALAMRELAAERRLRSLRKAIWRLGITSLSRLSAPAGSLREDASAPLASDALYLSVSGNAAATRSFTEGAWLNLRLNARCFEVFRKTLFVY